MKTNFNLQQAGKRLPYTVPEGFFEEIEDQMRKEVIKATTQRCLSRKRRRIHIATASIAVAAAILVALYLNRTGSASPASGFADVEQAFNRLSNEDRAYLVEVYQNDIFINEE